MFKHYLATALRHFAKYKVTTAINVFCLVLGLLCFFAADGMATWLATSDRQLPNGDRIYALTQKFAAPGVTVPTMPFTSLPPGEFLQVDIPELKGVARLTLSVANPVSRGQTKLFIRLSHADADFFKIFSWPFLYGDANSALRDNFSVVLTEATATKLFGDPAKAVGQTVVAYGGTTLTVTGVVAPIRGLSHLGDVVRMGNFDAVASMNVLLAAPMGKVLHSNWSAPFSFTYMLLPADGSFTADALRSRLRTFDKRHIPEHEWQSSFSAIPVSQILLSTLNVFVGTEKTGVSIVALLYALGVMVLGVSILNYANLATAHAASRAREMGLRRAMGARSSALAFQYISEATLLTLLAALIALVLVTAVAAAAHPADISAGQFAARYFVKQLLLLAAVTTGVGIAAAAYPIYVVNRISVVEALRTGNIRTGRRVVPTFLVALQFCATSFLIVAILVMTAQYKHLERAALSNINEPLVVVANSLDASNVKFETLRTELEKQPHVRSATAAMESPWGLAGSLMPVSASRDEAASRFTVCNNIVQGNYLATMSIKLIAGRDFDTTRSKDSLSFTDLVGHNERSSSYDGTAVIIDKALAELNGWTPEQAIDKTLFLWVPGIDSKAVPFVRVVGVVENRSYRLLGMGATASMYLHSPDSAALPIVRIANGDIRAALNEIDSVWDKLAPNVQIKRQLIGEALNDSLNIFNAISAGFKAVATLALVVAVFGLVGMSMHIIGRRTHEIGIRKSLGASVKQIIVLLLRDLSKPIIAANLIAWPFAFGAMSVYLSIFVARTKLSVTPFLVSLGITLLVAWIAVIVQATRAARLNPAAVLRYE